MRKTEQMDSANPPLDFNLADPKFWAQSPEVIRDAFTTLRQLDRPVFVTEQPARNSQPAKGYYALVKFNDVAEASRNAKVFSSEPGVTTPLPNPIATWVFGESMVNMDNPRHGRMRNIVQRAFSARNMAAVEKDIEQVVKRNVDKFLKDRPDDFVDSLACAVPFEVMCNMIGIPQAQRKNILQRIFATTERAHAEHAFKRFRIPGRGTIAMAQMHLMVMGITRHYRRFPKDDLITALVTTEIDGHRLGYRDLGAFFNTLMVAGVETTRNEIVHFLHLMTKHEDQRELLLSDFEAHIDRAIEEVVRYEPSIYQFRRHVRANVEVGGVEMKPGDQVMLFFHSANRDETIFQDAHKFDITREPNPHVGFGAGGPHTCLGKLLARNEMKYLFRELFTRAPQIRSKGTPKFLASNFDNRIVRLEYDLGELKPANATAG